MNKLYRLSDDAIELRLAALRRQIAMATPDAVAVMEADRQCLLSIRLERDIENMLAKMPPDRERALRPIFEKAIAVPGHRKWIDGEPEAAEHPPAPSVPTAADSGWDLKAVHGQCRAIVKDGDTERRCNARAISGEGLCSPHSRVAARRMMTPETNLPAARHA